MLNKIFITGSTGFVGSYLINNFKQKYNFTQHKKNDNIEIKEDIVLHFAGKAHDLQNVDDPTDYYLINTDLTKEVFDAFINSTAKVFIFISSIKAVADNPLLEVFENTNPKPETHYGKSKLLAEEYILNYKISYNKRIYILRPCMIHGPGNKGNLNLLYKYINFNLPWLLGSFNSKRSYCGIDNFCFIVDKLISNQNISSGIYNIADSETITTNELIKLISKTIKKNVFIFNIPKIYIKIISKIGDKLSIKINSNFINKLTSPYIVNNNKIINAIKSDLPYSTIDGLIKTIKHFKNIK